MLVRDVQLLNILLIFVTAAVLNRGTFLRDVQPPNILLIFVTAAVLNRGTFLRDVQPLNILLIFVTAAVLNRDTLVRDVQPPNILNVSDILLRTSKDTFSNEAKSINKVENETICPMFTPLKLTKLLQKTNEEIKLPNVILVKFGQESIISNIGEVSGKTDPVNAYF